MAWGAPDARPFAAALAAAALLAATAQARGEDLPDRPGVDLGLGVGYALPFGSLNDGPKQPLDDIIASTLPITVDAGYRLDHGLSVGLVLQYAFVDFASGQNACPPGTSCSGSIFLTGARVAVRLPASGPFVPWLGAGGGYEWFHASIKGDLGGGQTIDAVANYRGAMFGLVQLGADYRLSPQIGLGPLLGFAMSRYDHVSSSGTAAGMPVADSMKIPYKAFHEWLTIGFRGVFHL